MKGKLILDEVQLIGIDVGRSYVKAYSEFNEKTYDTMFKSIIGDARNTVKFEEHNNPIYITTNGNNYFIGALAEKESYNATRNSSDSKISLTVRTLIDAVLSEIAQSEKVKILLGVPNNCYRKSVLLDIINMYQGKTVLVKNNLTNSSKRINIEAIDIFKEADAVAYDVMRNKINEKDMAFISVGFRTSEISYFAKGMEYVDRLSKTIPYANQHMLGYVQNKLKDEYNITKEINEVDANNGDYDELKREAYELASESFTQRIESVIPNAFIETDIWIGGGTVLNLTLDERFNLIDNPQMSVARGLYYVATLLF